MGQTTWSLTMMVEHSESAIKVLILLPEPDNFIKEHALIKLLDIMSDVQKSYLQLCKEQDEKST